MNAEDKERLDLLERKQKAQDNAKLLKSVVIFVLLLLILVSM